MSFFGSIARMFKSLFGLAEGKTEQMTDRLVSGSPDAIRAQFRKTKEDWTRDFNQMRDAVAELIRIREMRMDEVKALNKESDSLEEKMAGAIGLFQKTPDPRYREAYAQLAAKNDQVELRIKELLAEIDEQQKAIERYKLRLLELQRQIENLKQEEAETVADIVSSQKIRELNDRLSGLSLESEAKNLEAIRSARQKAKAVAKLSNELTGSTTSDLERELSMAGAGTKHLDAFDTAVSGGRPKAKADPLGTLESAESRVSRDPVQAEIDRLLGKTPSPVQK